MAIQYLHCCFTMHGSFVNFVLPCTSSSVRQCGHQSPQVQLYISKTMFPVHMNDMHCNRDEGFTREFEVIVHMYCV